MVPSELSNFADEHGRITRLPVKLSKKIALSEWLITLLDPERTYAEKEVNEIFGEFVDDFALMRRMLVEAGDLKRDRYGYEYQRIT
jgi:hypothetical protein